MSLESSTFIIGVRTIRSLAMPEQHGLQSARQLLEQQGGPRTSSYGPYTNRPLLHGVPRQQGIVRATSVDGRILQDPTVDSKQLQEAISALTNVAVSMANTQQQQTFEFSDPAEILPKLDPSLREILKDWRTK